MALELDAVDEALAAWRGRPERRRSDPAALRQHRVARRQPAAGRDVDDGDGAVAGCRPERDEAPERPGARLDAVARDEVAEEAPLARAGVGLDDDGAVARETVAAVA